MEITVLGSGTSHGVPMIGCRCAVCLSDDPHNTRTRSSILVRSEQGAILVDTGPELRVQALANDVRQVDAVLFTHTHADHIFGLDDLRRFNDLSGQEIPVYGDASILDDIRRIFPYIFTVTQAGGGKPRLTLHEVTPRFELLGLHIESFYVLHGKLPVLAYRFTEERTSTSKPETAGDQEERLSGSPLDLPAVAPASSPTFAYVTDVSAIPEDSLAHLHGLDVLFLDAVRFEPHPTHFGLYQALDVIAEVQPRRAFLTHLSHHFDHEAVNAQLPPHVRLAYDGLTIQV